MKKYLIILLVLALVLCAGCKKQEAEPTTAPTTAPTTTEATEETTVPPTEETVPAPEVTMGSALVNKVPAVLSTLNREDLANTMKITM